MHMKAASNGKDEDFHRLSVLRDAPPKVVWLRLGRPIWRILLSAIRLLRPTDCSQLEIIWPLQSLCLGHLA